MATTLHPALPWYFKNLFDEHYRDLPTAISHSLSAISDPPSAISNSLRGAATRAFVEAMGELGSYYTNQYVAGNRDVIAPLTAEEPNLLHARRLARVNGWWHRVISTMQGLSQLYNHTGRRAEWKRLVEEIVPDFVDPATDLPLHGREEQWSLVTQHRVLLAEEARRWDEAERLQRLRVEWNRKNATPFLALPPESLNDSQKNVVRTLSVSVSELGHILREQGKVECIEAYQEDYDLSLRIGDKPGAAVTTFNLGRAYTEMPALRDLAQAERWYQRSLELRDERDRQRQARSVGQLGYVSWERFKDARKANAPNDELLKHLNDAARFYQQAIDLLPPDAVDDLAVAHNQLGAIYDDAGDLDRALHHFNEAIRYFESADAFYNAAIARFNVAVTLRNAGRLSDAREYAYAALRNYEQYGEATAKEQAQTKQLIERIEGEMKQ